MRKYTLLVSIVAHAGVVVAVVLATLTVTHTLPGVRPISEIVIVRAEPLPEPPPLPSARRELAREPVAEPTFSFEPPDGITPAPDVPRVEDVPGIVGVGEGIGIGHGPGDGVINEPPPPTPAPKPTGPLRVGGTIVAPTKTRHVAPVYPQIAMSARQEGVVVLDAIIGEDGVVRELRVLRSEPLLDQAALDAVRQWRFTPTLLNGQPTPVIMTVTVSFRLN